MLSSLLLSFNLVLPLLLWMAVGRAFRALLRLDEGFLSRANQLVFRLFLPALLFSSVYESDLAAALGGGAGWLIVYVQLGVAASFLLGHLLIPRFVRDPRRAGVVIQGAFRSNTALFGLPLAISLYGEGQIGLIALVMTVTILTFNVACVATLERFSPARAGAKSNVLSVLQGIAANPLIWALLLGLGANLAGLALPTGVHKALSGLAGCATPLSFVLLGAGVSFAAVAKNRAALAATVLLKLVAYPLVWVVGAALLGWRGPALAAALVIFAPATAISSHPMACALGFDEDLSASVVALTSVLSIPSIFLWVFALSSLNLL